MGLTEDIKAEISESLVKDSKDPKSTRNPDGLSDSPVAMMIEQKLNKLFYLSPNFREEIEMLKMQAKLKSEDRFGLHASSILASESEFCYREQVLSLFYKMEQGENIPIRLKRIFEEGNFIGEKWQRLFIRGGIGKKEDMDISRFLAKYDLSYTPDARITLFDKQFVVETKSQNTFTFRKSRSHPGGVKQLKFYMYLEDIPQGFVIVEDKNDQNFKILLVDKLDIAELEPYIERLENIQVYKGILEEENKMVPRHKSCVASNCKMATSCNMRNACWNVGEGRVRLDVYH